MSRLWGHERAQSAASVGSFVIRRMEGGFRPWSGDYDGGGQGSDGANDEDRARAREEAAYARGLADGRRTVEAELGAEQDAVARLAESLQTLRPQPSLPLAMLLAETVDRLVRDIVGEVEIDALRLLSRAKAAAALIAESTEPAKLRLHPQDAELLAEAALEIEIERDLALPRGTILLETADGWVEDGPAMRLDRLRAELDRIGAAQ